MRKREAPDVTPAWITTRGKIVGKTHLPGDVFAQEPERPDVPPRLTADEIEPSSWVRRLSPRKSWPALRELDERVEQLNQRRAVVELREHGC